VFDYWTSAMKEISSGVALARMSDSIAMLMTGKGSTKELAEAREFLAAAGLDDKSVSGIWAEMNMPGGADDIRGVLMPNTANWQDPDLVRKFRSGLRQEVDNTIVTPGFEKPLWMDDTLLGKILGQFKSFAMASTTKTLLAGLQQRDAAFVTGTMISLAMGAFSYYLWAVTTGGKAYTEMLNADIDKWADEAISRSGGLAVFGEVQRIAENLPVVRDYATFSGARTSRNQGGDLIDAVLGPSFDALEKATNVIVNLDAPTQNTLHSLRLLAPLQNLFFLRRAFDLIEASAGLPETRQ